MVFKLAYAVIAALFACYVYGNAHTGVSSDNAKCAELLTASPPAPDTSCCGRDVDIRSKILGGRHPTIDKYPWLALIEYAKEGRPIKTPCGGSLISARYVLTAGHCVTGAALSVGTPQNVRLGEYDTSTEGIDCQDGEAGLKDCNDGTVTIPIEEIIVHPEYIPRAKNGKHDIALIRLKQSAPFNDFIRPICLPAEDVTINPPSKLSLFEAGWGDKTQSKTVKLHDELFYMARDTCQEFYTSRHNVTLSEGQLCAGGSKTCTSGNAGGPLMHESHGFYEVVGVISFGPKPCSSNPSVYTKVYEYNAWIKSVIKD